MGVKVDYKNSEVGVIPANWDVKALGELARLYQPQTISAKNFMETGYPVYGANGIVGYYHSANHRTWQVTVTCRGSTCGTVNRTVDECWITGNAMVLNCDSNSSVNKLFLYQLLQGQDLSVCITGTGQPQIVRSPLASFPVPFPPLAEQQAIANALSDVDELIASLDKLIAKRRDLKHAAMQQLLTGKTRLQGFSGDWETKLFSELFTFHGGYTASRDDLTLEGHLYLHYGDIHGANTSVMDTKTDYLNIPKLDVSIQTLPPHVLLKDGDVVFVDASEDDAGASKHIVVSNIDRIPFIAGLHTIVARSKTEALVKNFKRYCFQTKTIRDQFHFYSVGTKVTGISKSNIAKLKLSYPSIAEQTAISEVLSDMDAELTKLEQRRDKTVALKQGMMQELLTGRTRLV